MLQIHDIKRRADILKDKHATGSITPEEVGGLFGDLALYIQSLERDGSTLGIRKVYPSLEAMQADKSPVDSNGRPLRRGSLVSIYNEATIETDPNNGLVCMYTGDGWVSVARIGTAMRNESSALEKRITLTEAEVKQIKANLQTAREEVAKLVHSLGYVRFHGFIDGCEVESTSLGSSDVDVVYCRSLNTFLAKVSSGLRVSYYNNWIGAEGYRETILSAPYPAKLYLYNGLLHYWTGSTLASLGMRLGEGEQDAFPGNRGAALEVALSKETEDRTAEDTRIAGLIAAERDVRARAVTSLEQSLEGERQARAALERKMQDQTDKGGGSGDYNVTQLHPLEQGYHTLQTAVAAVSASGVPDARRRGMVITLESSSGVWVNYRYVGDTTDEQFSSAPMWVEERGLKEVYVDGAKQAIEGGVLRIKTAQAEVTDSVDESDRPVTARAVKGEIDQIKALTLDSDTEQTDEGTQVTLSQEGRQVAQFTVAGGGGGGETSATKAKVTASVTHQRIKLGDAVELSYGYTHYTDGEQDGLPADLKVIIRRGVQEVAEIGLGSVASGESRTLPLGQYLTVAASYNISVVASYVEGDKPKTRTAAAQVSVVDLAIELYNRSEIQTYLSAGGYRDGDTANIIVAVKGGARELSMYIDGESQAHEVKALSGSGGRQTFILPLRTLSVGAHSIQLVARLDSIVSNSIYLDILKAGDHQPFVGLIFSRSDGRIFRSGETPELLAQQYLGCQWEYIAIGSGSGVATLSLHTPSGAKTFSAPRSYQVVKDRFLSRGSLAYRYELEGVSKPLNISVVPTEIEGIGIKEGAALELIASGRSNAEANPAQWQSGAYSAVFEGVDFRGSGWTGDALRLINGAKVRIGYKPFGVDAKTNGMTIIAEIKTSNVRRADEAVLSSYDREGHTSGAFGGFLVNPYEVKIPLGGRVEFRSEEGEVVQRDLEVKAPYASGAYYHIALVVHPESEQKNVRVYINGVLSKADVYQDTIFRQRTPQDIVLDSTAADLEIRHLRVYGTALTDDEVLRNYITDRPTLEQMEEMRTRNDVIDPQTGDISWDKIILKGGGALNIVMDGGLESISGKSTDTKTRYPVRELIFRSPYGRAYDLKATDCTIRRQGTSTSTYPHKNLRIELKKNSSSKVYRNTGAGGQDTWELVEDKTYRMRPDSKPMSIINIKVDYADSSLQNNIGGAKLWNKLCREIPALTNPGMQADSEARAALDGIPCCMFTSDSSEGKKRFFGTAMFNFDKSKSGYIFGQKKKDGTEIALEGINNTNAIANFRLTEDAATQLARKDAEGVDASFEFLYPEQDYVWATAPSNIKQSVTRLMQWVKDCTPAGVDPSRMATAEVVKKFKSAKFKREVAQYFSVQSLCAWYVWTDYMMAVDQRAKNTFWRCWDGLKWWITYYDGDTSWKKRNEAMLAYLYNITRDTWDAERNKWAFEGHNSILWCLVLANLEEELRAIAVDMRRVMTDEVVREHYNNPLRDFAEIVHNKSNIHKYIKPTYTDYNGGGTMNYIFALDGTMQAAKEDIIVRRFSLLDARYNPEDSVRRDNVPCYIGKGAVPTTIIVHAGDEYYFGWATQNGVTRQYERVETGASLTLNFPDAISQNDPVRLAGASRMRRIDLSTTAPYMQGAMNLNTCRMLEELIAPISSGQGLPWFLLLGSISGLKRIDLTGQSAVTGTESAQSMTFDASSHTGLMELKLSGTAVRAIRLAEGAPISRLELPASLDKLRLRALPNLAMSGLVVPNWEAITSLELAGCPQLDWQVLVGKCTGLERLRVEGVDMEDDGTLLARLRRLKGIDASGSGVETCSLAGRCQLTKYIDDELFKDYQAHFPELSIRQPHYTAIKMDDNVSIYANISNPDNETGYGYSKPYAPSGHVKAILDARHGVLVKRTGEGQYSVCRLHDGDWRFYADNPNTTLATPAKVDGTEGELYILEPRYWYKGIRAKDGMLYACYAHGVKPDDPVGVKTTIAQIKRGERNSQWLDGYAVSIGSTLSEALRKVEGYAVCVVDVSGYKRVSFQAAVEYGGVFLDASGTIIRGYSVQHNNRTTFNDGMMWYEDVPSNAKLLYFTILKEMGNDFGAWATNSMRIEDIEPDWIEHKPVLVSAVRMSLDSGRVRSIILTPGESEPWTNQTLEQFRAAFRASKVEILDYETRKDIINLFFAKYGTRCSSEVFGNAEGYYYSLARKSKLGEFLATGMQDTYFRDGKRYRLTTAAGSQIAEEYTFVAAKEMGYEAFSYPASEFVSGLNHVSDFGGQTRHVFNASGRKIALYTRNYRAHQFGNPVARVVHGARMDILPLNSEDPKRGDTLNYGNNMRLGHTGAEDVVITGWYHLVDGRNGALCMRMYGKNEKQDWLSCRGMLRGEIKEIKDIETYKSIVEVR